MPEHESGQDLEKEVNGLRAFRNSVGLLLEERDFSTTVRKIFDACCDVIGGRSGYVALFSDDGKETEVLFLESGGLPCTVDPDLPKIIRGVRNETFAKESCIYDNNFSDSKWQKYMPRGHVTLKNVLFTPLIIDGKVLGVMGFANKNDDFTADDVKIAESYGELVAIALKHNLSRKALQEKERQLRYSQKMEALGTLAGGIAHDFNNILFPIIGNAELTMRDVPEGSDAHECLEDILRSANRAKDLVRQILIISRKSDDEKYSLELQPLIKEVIKMIRASVPRAIQIKQYIKSDCRPILGNAVQMHQVMINLCSNAYHAMQEDGGTMFVKLTEETLTPANAILFPNLPRGEYVKLVVADSGRGMDEQTRRRIFEPYFSTKDKKLQSGLGLAVVHGIVKNHNGDIDVVSQPGEGATFTVLLPIHEEQKDAPQLSEEEQRPPGHGHLLVVDDEPAILRVVKKKITQMGYQVTAFEDSQKALDHFKSEDTRFDLVITDMSMPQLSGVQLSKALLEIRPDIPIILCTGFSEQVDEAHTEKIGIAKYLLKPVSMNDLASAVRELLAK